jgi:hypothetical protein
MEGQMKRGGPSAEEDMLGSNSQKRATKRRWLQKIRNASVGDAAKTSSHAYH